MDDDKPDYLAMLDNCRSETALIDVLITYVMRTDPDLWLAFIGKREERRLERRSHNLTARQW